MFDIYEHCFGLEIRAIDPGYKWVDDLTLHLISDAESGEPLGLVYLDMFPRDGKFGMRTDAGLQDEIRQDARSAYSVETPTYALRGMT